MLEGVFARGDRKVGKVIEEAYRLGCLYDSWSESFDNEKWMQAFANTGVDIEFTPCGNAPWMSFFHGISSISA